MHVRHTLCPRTHECCRCHRCTHRTHQELLYNELRLLPPQLPAAGSELDAATSALPAAQGPPAPAAGTQRAQRACQAHALALAEAGGGTGSQWWLPLQAINRANAKQAADPRSKVSPTAGGAVVLGAHRQEREWAQLQAACHSNWEAILAAERQRR